MKKNKKESGQALIELIIFLPLMFTLYSVVSGFANAINASINQQKITRSYFYYRVQNNSTIPKPDQDKTWEAEGWSSFGMFFIGWMERFGGTGAASPLAPCYKMTIPLNNGTEDCEEKYTTTSTQYIRVGTVYGLCGATYANLGNGVVPEPDKNGGQFESVVDISSCLIQ